MIHMTKTTVPALLFFAGGLAACGSQEEPAQRQMALAEAASAELVVYKTPTCGCCSAWVDHMRKAGYEVRAVDVDYAELVAKKREHGVSQEKDSCHTGVIDGYVVEGHVPADVVARMLRERPDIQGIAVPGMPLGSPGMEGLVKQSYDIVTIERDGPSRVYESR